MANKRKIYFRADAGPNIGYGHYIRSLALADMLKQDFDSTMFTQVPTEYQLREAERICAVVALPDDDRKFNKFLDYLKGDEIVVLDNYFFTTDYQRAIKDKGCKLVCIDDMHDKHYVADIVINHAPGFTRSDYSLESYTQLCTGLNWSLLRAPFIQEQKVNNRNGCLVCLGGADMNHLSEKVVDIVLRSTEGDVHLVVGDINLRAQQLQDKYGNNSRVQIHKAISACEMASLMSSTKWGIISASGLLWEATACGLPVLYGYYIDNQIEICKRNKRVNRSVCVGDFRALTDDALAAEIELFTTRLNDGSFNSIRPNIKKNYIDLFSQKVSIRPIEKADCDLLFAWANDPLTRSMAFSKEQIPYEQHVKWFERKLASDSLMYICYANEKPIGQVRFDIEESSAYVDISLAPESRGRAYGKEILRATTQEVLRNCPHMMIVADVLIDNIPSQRMFEACGYKRINADNTKIQYELRNCFREIMESSIGRQAVKDFSATYMAAD